MRCPQLPIAMHIPAHAKRAVGRMARRVGGITYYDESIFRDQVLLSVLAAA